MLIIDSDNISVLEGEIYIHDCLFDGMRYNYSANSLMVLLRSSRDVKKQILIEYNNVLAYEMISCDYWGSSNRVCGWENIENDNRVILDRLYKEKREHNYIFARIDENIRYIETRLVLISGDTLRVVCEQIFVNDESQ